MRELENYLYAALEPKIQHLGFKWIKSRNLLIKKDKNGFSKFFITTTDLSYDAVTEISLSLVFCVRINAVEDLMMNYYTVSHPKYYRQAATHCASWGQLNGDNKKELIINQRDTDDISDTIFDIFINEGLPFFETNSSVEQLDKLYNDNPDKVEVSIKRQSQRITLSLVLAKLTQREDYSKLIEKYENDLCLGKYGLQVEHTIAGGSHIRK